MANPEIIIVRHAKSDWHSAIQSDFGRPLNQRGRDSAILIGNWIKVHSCQPDLIIASPASRAAETIQLVCEAAVLERSIIQWQDRVYLASLESLLEILQEQTAVYTGPLQRLMLVGHNPGLDSLLKYLCHDWPKIEDGKLLTTACLAWLRLPDWSMRADDSELLAYVRPKSLLGKV